MIECIKEIPELTALKAGTDASKSLELFKRVESQLSYLYAYIAVVYIYVRTSEIKQRFPEWNENEIITEDMLIDCKVYVGQSKNVKQRLICFTSRQKYAGKKFEAERDMNDYGGRVEGWKYKILELIISDDIMEVQELLNMYEKRYVDIFNSIEKGYNTAKPGCVNTITKQHSILEPFKLELVDIPLMLTEGENFDFDVCKIDIDGVNEYSWWKLYGKFEVFNLKKSNIPLEIKYKIKNEVITGEWVTKDVDDRYRYVSKDIGGSIWCAVRGLDLFLREGGLDSYDNEIRNDFIKYKLELLGVEELDWSTFYLYRGRGCSNAVSCCRYKIIKTDTKTVYSMQVSRSIKDLSMLCYESYSTVRDNVLNNYEYYGGWRYCKLSDFFRNYLNVNFKYLLK